MVRSTTITVLPQALTSPKNKEKGDNFLWKYTKWNVNILKKYYAEKKPKKSTEITQ